MVLSDPAVRPDQSAPRATLGAARTETQRLFQAIPHDGLLGVQAVLCLVENDGMGAVHHGAGDFVMPGGNA
jgi:hypothetical protein